MTLRTLIVAASALALSTGLAATGAEAATKRPVHRVAAHAAPHKPTMRHTAMRHHGRGMATASRSRGRDAESSSVDQLNAQSLAAARGGSAPAAVPAPAPAAQ